MDNKKIVVKIKKRPPSLRIRLQKQILKGGRTRSNRPPPPSVRRRPKEYLIGQSLRTRCYWLDRWESLTLMNTARRKIRGVVKQVEKYSRFLRKYDMRQARIPKQKKKKRSPKRKTRRSQENKSNKSQKKAKKNQKKTNKYDMARRCSLRHRRGSRQGIPGRRYNL